MIIDAHAHILPRDFPQKDGYPRMEEIDGETARTLFFGATRFTARETFFDVERRLEALDESGVDEEIVSPMPPLLNYTLDAATGLSLFRYVNEVVAQYVQNGQGRIHGLGIVPMQDPEAAAAELSGFAGLGLRGVQIGSHINGVEIGDARFAGFFQEMERLGLSVFVHTLPRADEAGLAATMRGSIGVGIEAARAAASLAFGGHAQACALDHVLFSHAAGGFPLMLARADYFWEMQNEETRAAETPSAVARRFFYDSMVFDPRGLRFIIDYLGADRVVLGTDFPAMPRRGQLSSMLDDVELSSRDFDKVAFHNAKAFLGVGSAAFA